MIALLAALQMAAAEPACIRAEVVPGFEAWGQAGASSLAVGAPTTLTLTPVKEGGLMFASGRAATAPWLH